MAKPSKTMKTAQRNQYRRVSAFPQIRGGRFDLRRKKWNGSVIAGTDCRRKEGRGEVNGQRTGRYKNVTISLQRQARVQDLQESTL